MYAGCGFTPWVDTEGLERFLVGFVACGDETDFFAVAFRHLFAAFGGSAVDMDEILDALKPHFAALDAAALTGKHKAQLEALRKTVAEMRVQLPLYQERLARNMAELLKERAINTNDPGAPALRVSTYTMGEVRAMREPPKKKQKKAKRPNPDAPSASVREAK